MKSSSRWWLGIGLLLVTCSWFGVSPAPLAADPVPLVPLSPEDTIQPLVPLRARSESDHDKVVAAAHFAQARVLFQREDYAGALAQYQRAWRYHPEVVSVLREIVPLAVELERNEEASRYAVIAAESDPRDEGLLRRLGVYLAERDEYERALKLFEKSLALHKDPRPEIGVVLLRLEMGRLHFLTGKFPAAAEHLTLVQQALEEPAKFNLTPEHQKLLLGKPEATYTLLTEVFFQADKFTEADAAAQKLHEAQPNAGLLAFHKARSAAGRKDNEAALKLLEEYFAAKTSVAGPDAYELLGKLLAAKTTDAAAAKKGFRERLTALRENDPGNAPLTLALAHEHMEAKDWDAAEKLYDEQLKLQPIADALQGKLAIGIEKKDTQRILTTLGEAVLGEGSLEAVAEEAKKLIDNKELTAQVIAAARKLTAEEAAKYPAGSLFAAALLSLDAHDFASANDLFERSLANPLPKKPQVLLTWGLGLFLGEQYARSAEIFQRAIREQALPENPAHVHFLLANALEFAGRTEEALVAANEAVKLSPRIPRYQSRLAWIPYHAKRFDAAEKAYRALLEKFDKDHKSPGVRDEMREARLVLSHIEGLRGNIPAAQEWLEQVLDEFPEDIGAQNDLSYLWSERGLHRERALRLAQNAVRGEPENDAYRDSLGWAYYQLGKYPEAVAELEKAAAIEKPDGTILDHLGDAYLKASQKEKALASWQKAVDAFREAKENDKVKSTEEKIKANK